jgi:signal transduction histidine kinase
MRAINRIWIVLFLLLAALPAAAVTVLERASVVITSGTLAFSSRPILLPFQWNQENIAAERLIRFQLIFPATDLASEQAIYIARNGNRFRVLLNEVVIGEMGHFGNMNENYAKQPHMFLIPKGLLTSKNTLEIVNEVQGGGRAGLSTILIGQSAEILDIYQRAYRWRVTGSLVVAVISLVLGIIAMLLWLRQRDQMFLWYGLSELLWALHIGDTQMVVTPVAWPWWGLISLSAFAIAPALICKFSLELLGLHRGWQKILLNSYIFLSLPVLLLALIGNQFWLWELWKVLLASMSASVGFFVVRYGLRSAILEQRLLAIAVLVIVAVVVRDLGVLLVLPYLLTPVAYASWIDGNFWLMDISWTRYAWCIFGVTLAWIIAERMRKATLDLSSMNRTLFLRLAQREVELKLLFAEQSDAGRHQGIIEERQRLTRDMHDGLGSQLLGALHLSQDPLATRDALTRQLRETLDHLKLTVDAMQDTEGDIASLLGALRYRLGPRLESAGIRLDWSVDTLPAIAGWGLQQSRDLQMILFEAFSNLISHSGATQAVLRAEYNCTKKDIEISLQDNGCGFEVDATAAQHGHGIVNMRMRATRLNARLSISNTSGTSGISDCSAEFNRCTSIRLVIHNS